jgi:hypothetical protein
MAKRYYKQKKYFSLQNETKIYIKRLSTFGKVLNGADIADLDNFIAGLKQLGLYQRVICYPLRTIHNIGTGTKVLGFGGLGIYDGTTVNTPTWGNTGITFNGSSQRIRLQLSGVDSLNRLIGPFSRPDNTTMMACVSSSTTTFQTLVALESIGEINSGSNPNTLEYGNHCISNYTAANGSTYTFTKNTGEVGRGNTLANFPPTTFYTAIGRRIPAITYRYYNGASEQSQTEAAGGSYFPTSDFTNLDLNVIGMRAGGTQGFFNGIISFVMVGDAVLSTTSAAQDLHNLYKTTIGKELGLP